MTELFDLFCDLAGTPSPSMGEEKVAEKILSFFKNNHIEAVQDDFGNVYAKVPATDITKPSLMLSAHMDVVGDYSPVPLVVENDFVQTDGSRTLGADDKAGVSVAMMFAKELSLQKEIMHGGLEVVFTRDEEQGMSGVRAIDFKALSSQYILVLDADRIGDFLISGAGFTKMFLSVKTFKGGHSGVDIQDADRVNAVKVISEVISLLPQGVYHQDETGVVTSLNVGAVVGGGVKNFQTALQGVEYASFLTENAMSNVINTDAFALYSIRSSSKKIEQSLKEEIESTIATFNQDYENKAEIKAVFEEHMPAFEKSEETSFLAVAQKAGEKIAFDLNISSFHAGAETHVYASQKNASGQTFQPYLVGVANIFDMHSAQERMEITSLEKGFEFIRSVFYTFNEE